MKVKIRTTRSARNLPFSLRLEKVKNNKEIVSQPKFDKVHKKVERENKGSVSLKRGSTHYLIWFLVFVGIFIGTVLFTRTIFLFQKGTFTNNSYSILIQGESSHIYVLEKNTPKFSIIKIPQSSERRIGESLRYSMPIDAYLKTNSNDALSFLITLNVLFKPWDFYYENMTSIDHLAFILKTFLIQEDKINRYELKISKDGDIDGITQEEIYEVFKDPQIINEGLSVSIVNATRKDGLGGNVAQVIRNIGGNIVSVSSMEEKNYSSVIAEEDSSTLHKISSLLGIKKVLQESKSEISDIKIIIGKDFGKRMR